MVLPKRTAGDAAARHRTVPVRVLKDRLSEYLNAVDAGATVVVTSHGRPIADLVPHRARVSPNALLVREATRPWGSVRLARAGLGRTDTVSLLIAERRRR
jgi:prevent-host-death family protein